MNEESKPTTRTSEKTTISKQQPSRPGPLDSRPQANVAAAPVTTDASQAADTVSVETTETTTETTQES